MTRAKRLLTNSYTLQIILSATILYITLSILLNNGIFIRSIALGGLFSGLFLAALLLLGKSVYNRYFNVSDDSKILIESIEQIILSKPNKIGHPQIIIRYHEDGSEKLRVLQLMPTYSKTERDSISDVEDILVQNNLNVKYRDEIG